MNIRYLLQDDSQPPLPEATNSHAPVIGHLVYPHIFDRIFEHAEYPALVRFRATCRSLRERVDGRFSIHLLVRARSLRILTMGRHAIPSLANNLPDQTNQWSDPRRARLLLSRTQVVDYVGSVRFPTKLKSVIDELQPNFGRVWGDTNGTRLPSSIDTLVVFGWSSPYHDSEWCSRYSVSRRHASERRSRHFADKLNRPVLANVNLDPTTVVLNLSLSGKTSMETVRQVMPNLSSEGVRDIVIIMHRSEGPAPYQEDPELGNEAVEDLATILRFINSRWLTSPTTPRIIIVDLHLISPDEPMSGLLKLALRDYARLRAGDDPELSAIGFYNQSPGNVLSRKFLLPDDSITLMSKQEYSAQIGQERFSFYTDESFFLE